MHRRTDDELRDLSEHLLYEMEMLAFAVEEFGAGWEQFPTDATKMEAVLLESWAVHARNLVTFLYPPPPERWQPDDAFAEQYFDPGEWDRIRPRKAGILATIPRRAGKELAHLTYARLKVTPDLKPWKVGEMTNALAVPLSVFVQNVPAERVSDRFRLTARVHVQNIPVSVATGLAPAS